MPRLLLWDIDGTLLTAAGVNRSAMYAAVCQVLERDAIEPVELQTAGRTDPQIVRDLLTGLNVEAEDMDLLVKKTLRRFGPELAARRLEVAAKGETFAGVREILTELEATRNITTVLTGNIAVNAICKLDAFRLTRYFDLEVGGFGSDKAIRTELVDVVLDRVAQKRNKYFNEEDIWIIGDTPLDFEVAQANNLRCLLVATGRHSFEELESLGADEVMKDLTDTAKLMDLLADPIVKTPEGQPSTD